MILCGYWLWLARIEHAAGIDVLIRHLINPEMTQGIIFSWWYHFHTHFIWFHRIRTYSQRAIKFLHPSNRLPKLLCLGCLWLLFLFFHAKGLVKLLLVVQRINLRFDCGLVASLRQEDNLSVTLLTQAVNLSEPCPQADVKLRSLALFWQDLNLATHLLDYLFANW